ncbi:MAG: hypothetical protein ACR2JS_07470 [Candidatus Nanopelagicales bacterium]
MPEFIDAGPYLASILRQSALEHSLGFAKSSRRHRIGRSRMVACLLNAPRLFLDTSSREDGKFLMAIGSDTSGRLLEIGVTLKDNGEAVIIHAMDSRQKSRDLLAKEV